MIGNPATQLPLSQKMALLWVRRAGAESLAYKVTECMRAMGVRFGQADLETLVREGMIRRNGSRHELLPRGLAHAQIIARDLAEQYRLHHIERRAGAGNMGPTVSCTCGWKVFSSNRGRDELMSRAALHLKAVANGTWRPPRRIDDIVRDVLANLSSPTGDAPGTRGAVPFPSGAAPLLSSEAGHG